MAGVSSGKYSLENIMDELKNIKETQERYSQRYLQSQTGSAPPNLSFVARDDQGLQLRAIADSIWRLEGIVEKLAKGLQQTERELDSLEQYGCHNCLILHGSHIPTMS